MQFTEKLFEHNPILPNFCYSNLGATSKASDITIAVIRNSRFSWNNTLHPTHCDTDTIIRWIRVTLSHNRSLNPPWLWLWPLPSSDHLGPRNQFYQSQIEPCHSSPAQTRLGICRGTLVLTQHPLSRHERLERVCWLLAVE